MCNDKQIERITSMEKAMNRLASALKQEGALNRSTLADYRILDAYYQKEWQEDYEADEAGKLPAGLRRGVLSEDGLYDILCDADQKIREQEEKE